MNKFFDIMNICHDWHNAKMTGQPWNEKQERAALRKVFDMAYDDLSQGGAPTIAEKMDKINDLICEIESQKLTLEQHRHLNTIGSICSGVAFSINND